MVIDFRLWILDFGKNKNIHHENTEARRKTLKTRLWALGFGKKAQGSG
jgi:hypothetical protein